MVENHVHRTYSDGRVLSYLHKIVFLISFSIGKREAKKTNFQEVPANLNFPGGSLNQIKKLAQNVRRKKTFNEQT